MSGKLFKTVKAEVLKCNKFPEKVKEILSTANNSLTDLDENNFIQLWILLHDFIKETSVLEDITENVELLACYERVLDIINCAFNCKPEMLYEYGEGHLIKTITIFQCFYPKKIKYKFKLEIVKIHMKLWQQVKITQSGFDQISEHFIFTFNYIFDTIKTTTKKSDMKTLSTLLWEFCKDITLTHIQKNLLNLIVSNLEKFMKHSLFLETETGKMVIADIFTANQQLFLRLHQIIKENLTKFKKLEAESYGEIYFIAWINSNASMREIIEQQGMFDLISTTIKLQRNGLAFRTYRNALIILKSMQRHKKHLLFSKVITKLYTPILWRQLTNEFSVIRCNATEILTWAYPLEKRGEGREISSRFLIKQQNAFLDLLEDRCPQVRIAAIKGICCCMQYFWDTFEIEQIHKYFSMFSILIVDSSYEVRRNLYYGFCQLLDEYKSHDYFKEPSFINIMKNSIKDDNERVRRAFIHFLLKIKKIDNQIDNVNKINFAKITSLQDIASALALEDKLNAHLIVDLIFDNFIGDKVQDKNATLMRFNTFYKINPTSFRKLILYSEKNLDFDSAYELILSLLKAVYCRVKKKEESLKNKDKENNISAKRFKKSEDSDKNMSDSSSSSYSSDNNENNEQVNLCCILDCVYCLMCIHHDTFIDEKNHNKKEDIRNACNTCLVKLLKLSKEGDAYFSAMNLASLIKVSKLSEHIPVSSIVISTLKQLLSDIKQAEEDFDIRKVDCLVHTLCMWRRGYEILQLVNVWFNEAFKTLNLNETQYPESKIRKGKRVRFQTEECKPLTGILLINSILFNPQTRKTLMDSDINKKNVYDLFLYLQRVELAIETRITSDTILNNLLSDEVLIELFILKMRLYIIYYSYEKSHSVDEIIKCLTSNLDWIKNNLLIRDLHFKQETTVTLVIRIIEAFNDKLANCCTMLFVNNTILNNFLTFCSAILHNYLGSHILMSMITTLISISNHLNYQKCLNNVVDTSTVTNCVCSIISFLSESKYNEENFKNIIGDPTKFRHQLVVLIMEINKINTMDFQQIFITLIETIIHIIRNRIHEIDEFDVNEQLTEMPFAAYQLTAMILNNEKLRKHFSSNAVNIFSSDMYKNDCVLLLSSISFIYTLSFQLKKTIVILNLEPSVKVLYESLKEYNERMTTPLCNNNCSMQNIKNNDVSILETSDFSNHKIVNFQQKARAILVSTAKQLRISLTD